MTGLDRSPSQLRIARAKFRARGHRPRFVLGDMSRFDLRRQFDVTISMFGGFGYMLTDRALKTHFASVRRHLSPDGLYTFEFWHRPAARDNHASWVHKERPPEIIRLDVSRVDRVRSRMTMEMQFFVLEGGRLVDRFTEVHVVRLYTVPETRTLLQRSRFRLVGAYAGTPQKKGFDPVRRDTFRVTAVAKPLP